MLLSDYKSVLRKYKGVTYQGNIAGEVFLQLSELRYLSKFVECTDDSCKEG